MPGTQPPLPFSPLSQSAPGACSQNVAMPLTPPTHLLLCLPPGACSQNVAMPLTPPLLCLPPGAGSWNVAMFLTLEQVKKMVAAKEA